MRRLELAYALFGIVYYEQGIIQALRAARGADALKPGSSDIVSSVAQLAILCVLLLILAARRGAYRPLVRPMLPYAAIVALCFASTLWSDNPVPTLRRSLTLGSCVLFGVYLWRTYGLRGAITLAGQSAVFLGVLSVAVFAAVPSIGRETALGYENAMRGVFSQKNPMAECMLLGVTCYCFRLLDERVRARHLGALAILLLCIALGRSATSLGIAALVLFTTAFMAARHAPRIRLLLGLGAGWVALSAVVLGVVAPEVVFALLGRDASLTGRGPLWHEVIHVIARRPLLGHGYAGFWNEDSRDVLYLWLRAGWRAPDSHNGYLDITVQLGAVGLLAYLALWFRVAAGAGASLRAGTLRESRWLVLFMVVNVVLNLDEGPMPFANGFSMLMPGALLSVAAWRDRQRALAARRRWQRTPPLVQWAR